MRYRKGLIKRGKRTSNGHREREKKIEIYERKRKMEKRGRGVHANCTPSAAHSPSAHVPADMHTGIIIFIIILIVAAPNTAAAIHY